MAGYLKSLTIDGYTFAVPSDCEPKFHLGGEQIVDKITFGNNKSRGIKGVVAGKIEGLQVDVSELSALENLLGRENLPVRAETDDTSYTCDGMIVVESVNVSGKTKITDNFDIISNSGKLKHS